MGSGGEEYEYLVSRLVRGLVSAAETAMLVDIAKWY
jgi:hypothetical protein